MGTECCASGDQSRMAAQGLEVLVSYLLSQALASSTAAAYHKAWIDYEYFFNNYYWIIFSDLALFIIVSRLVLVK